MNFTTIAFSLKVFLVSIILMVTSNFLDSNFDQLKHHWVDSNIIRGQNFLSTRETYSAVVLGSSITAGLRLDRKIFNLSISSNGASTGIEILLKKEKLPDIVIVETNYLYNQLNESIVENIDNYSFNFPFSLFNVFKKKVKFLNFIKEEISDFLRNSLNRGEFKSRKENLVLSYKERFYPDDFNKKEVSRNVKTFFEKADLLIKKGTRFIYVKTPLHPLLDQSLKNKFSHQQMRKHLSGVEIINIAQYDADILVDGIHPTKEGREIFTREINRLVGF